MRVSRSSSVQLPIQSPRSQRTSQSSTLFPSLGTALTKQGLGSKSIPVRKDSGFGSLVADTTIPNRPTKGQNSGGADTTLASTLVASSTAKAAKSPASDGPALTGNISIDAIAMLSANLRQRGFDPANFSFSYSEQPVYYPGGSYMNRQITAQVNGQIENYDAGLVMKNPEVAAVEMLRLLGHRA